MFLVSYKITKLFIIIKKCKIQKDKMYLNCVLGSMLKFVIYLLFYFIELKRALVQKYSITEDDYRMMEVAIIENKPHKAGPQWKFAGAFYFSTVVLAMIGI